MLEAIARQYLRGMFLMAAAIEDDDLQAFASRVAAS